MDSVTGLCPACGLRGTLFVAAGGHITCSLDRCPEPGIVDDLLNRPPYHVIGIGENGWALQHAVTCFPNLLDCDVHQRVDRMMSQYETPPVPYGRYRLTDRLQFAPLEGVERG